MIGRSGVLSQCQTNVKPRLVRKDGKVKGQIEKMGSKYNTFSATGK